MAVALAMAMALAVGSHTAQPKNKRNDFYLKHKMRGKLCI